MKRILMLCAAFSVVASLFAADVKLGTKDEAIAMVKKGMAYVEKVGAQKALEEMTKTNGMFIDRDLYLFALDFTGHSRANGQTPSLVGKDLSDMKDKNGYPFVQEMIALAKKSGSGWIKYIYKNKVTGADGTKLAYVERIGSTEILIGCGVVDVSAK